MKGILSHFCFWREIGNEAKFSFVAFLPVFIAIFLPIIYPLLISLTYSNQSVVERNAVVMDLDNSALSRDLTLSMDATQGVHITRSVSSLEDGIQAVMSREADAFIFIPDDFSGRIKRFEQGNLKVYVYATNMMIYAAVMTGVQQTVLDKNVEIAVARIANPNGVTGERAIKTIDPIQYSRYILYAPTLAYASYICPILLTIVFHQMGLLILAFSIGYHREKDDAFKRRKLWYIEYFWRYLYYLPFILLGTFIVYYIICPLFGWPCDNPTEMMKLMILLVVCQMPLAIIIASFCKDRFTSFQFILGLSLFFFTLSGYVWPKYSMPLWIQSIVDYLAIEPMASAMRKIAFKNSVLMDCHQEIHKLVRLHLLYLAVAIVVVHRDLLVWPFQKIYRSIRKTNAEALPEQSPLPQSGSEQTEAQTQ